MVTSSIGSELERKTFLFKYNNEFRAKLDAMKMPYEYRESEGGHIWVNWRLYLSEFAPILFK